MPAAGVSHSPPPESALALERPWDIAGLPIPCPRDAAVSFEGAGKQAVRNPNCVSGWEDGSLEGGAAVRGRGSHGRLVVGEGGRLAVRASSTQILGGSAHGWSGIERRSLVWETNWPVVVVVVGVVGGLMSSRSRKMPELFEDPRSSRGSPPQSSICQASIWSMMWLQLHSMAGASPQRHGCLACVALAELRLSRLPRGGCQ